MNQFGFACNHYKHINWIHSKMMEVKKSSGLVLISEFWEESSLFLTEILQANLTDVVLLDHAKPDSREKLSKESVKSLEKLLWPDIMFYNLFSDMIRSKIKQLSLETIQANKLALQAAKSQLERDCFHDKGNVTCMSSFDLYTYMKDKYPRKRYSRRDKKSKRGRLDILLEMKRRIKMDYN